MILIHLGRCFGLVPSPNVFNAAMVLRTFHLAIRLETALVFHEFTT